MATQRVAVHLVNAPDPEWRRYLQSLVASNVDLTWGPLLPDPARYHILVAGRPSRKALEASPDLQLLVIPWAGLPETTRALLRDYPHLAVYNLHHNAASAAEMALALLLAAAKFIVPMDRALRAHDWRPRYGPNPAVRLMGRTAPWGQGSRVRGTSLRRPHSLRKSRLTEY